MAETTAPADLLTTTQAAAALGLVPRAVRDLIDRGRLPALRLGPRALVIRRADLDAYAAQRQGAKRGPKTRGEG